MYIFGGLNSMMRACSYSFWR